MTSNLLWFVPNPLLTTVFVTMILWLLAASLVVAVLFVFGVPYSFFEHNENARVIIFPVLVCLTSIYVVAVTILVPIYILMSNSQEHVCLALCEIFHSVLYTIWCSIFCNRSRLMLIFIVCVPVVSGQQYTQVLVADWWNELLVISIIRKKIGVRG